MATNVQRDISQMHFSNSRPVLKSDQIGVDGGIANATYAAAQNIDDMEIYLLTQGYTQTTLNSMTKNDKVYAYRLKRGSTTAP